MIVYYFFPLSLVPPAAKEGKGDCEFPLCPPWILLLPLCNAGHCVPGGGYGRGVLSIELSITGGQFYGTWLIWLPCSLAQTMLLFCWGADAQLLLVGVLLWQLIPAASFFHVGVGVYCAAMLWLRTRYNIATCKAPDKTPGAFSLYALDLVPDSARCPFHLPQHNDAYRARAVAVFSGLKSYLTD